MKQKHSRADAMRVAKEIYDHLKDCCVPRRMICGGSLRRKKDTVSDVDFVLTAKRMSVKDPGSLFGDMMDVSAVDVKVEDLVKQGVLKWVLGEAGQTMFRLQHCQSGIHVDLFYATEDNWSNVLTCRTGGPASNIKVCNAANARGLTWNPMSPGFMRGDSLAFKVRSEADVFERVGLPYLPPELRE